MVAGSVVCVCVRRVFLFVCCLGCFFFQCFQFPFKTGIVWWFDLRLLSLLGMVETNYSARIRLVGVALGYYCWF